MKWSFTFTPNQDEWRKEVTSALFEYSKDNSDQKWKEVESAFIQGWEIQYKAINA